MRIKNFIGRPQRVGPFAELPVWIYPAQSLSRNRPAILEEGEHAQHEHLVRSSEYA